MENSDLQNRRRKRVARACSVCRKKKVKCDGNEPCANCTSSNHHCVYDTVKKPEKRRKRVSNSESINTLNSRLEKLEGLLERISDKFLAPIVQEAGYKSDKNESETESEDNDQNVTESEIDDYDKDTEDEHTSEIISEEPEAGPKNTGDVNINNGGTIRPIKSENQKKKISRVSNVKNGTDSGVTESTGTKAVSNSAHFSRIKLREYFGSHSLFCIFSDKSIEWLKSKLPPKHLRLLTPIKKLPLIIERWVFAFSKPWIDPPIPTHKQIQDLRTGAFPDYDLVMTLLDVAYERVFLASFLCDLKTVKNLFIIYYKNKGLLPQDKSKTKNGTDSETSESAKRKLQQSELLIMNVSLAFCTAVIIDKKHTVSDRTCEFESLREVGEERLFALQQQSLENSIFYYSRVSTFSEGIRTIQGILLLVIFIEMSTILPDLNYMLTAVAVRLAQSIGLHRFESFEIDSQEVADLKRTVWWFCQCLDMEFCYRNGKPPMINADDVTTLTEKDTQSKISPNVFLVASHCEETPIKDGKNGFNIEDSRKIAATKGFHSYTCYVLTRLNRIRAKSYSELFSANVPDFTVRNLVVTLNDYNSQMCELAENIDERLRPRLHTDPLFKDIPYELFFEMKNVGDCGAENYIAIQFAYLQHLMTINRIPFLIENGDENQPFSGEFLPFRNLALDCARTILLIRSRLDPKTTPTSFTNWALFCPFTAYLILLGNCLNHSTTQEILEDIKLLSMTSMKVFASKDSKINDHSPNRQRDLVVDMSVRIMLRILITVVEANTGINIYDNEPDLKEHLERYEKEYPELYRGRHDIVNSVFEDFKYSSSPSSEGSLASKPHSRTSPNGYAASPRTKMFEEQYQQQQHQQQHHLQQQQKSNVYRGSMPTTYESSSDSVPLNSSSNGYSSQQGNNVNSFNQASPNYANCQPFFYSNSSVGQNSGGSFNNGAPPASGFQSKKSPSISSIINPVGPTSNDNNMASQNIFGTGIFSDNEVDETFTSMMNNLPNYFFDNNLGI